MLLSRNLGNLNISKNITQNSQINYFDREEKFPKEFLFDGEQELLKKFHHIKKELKEPEWSQSPPPKVTQPSFLRTNLGNFTRKRGLYLEIV